jgi:hypothetical protein
MTAKKWKNVSTLELDSASWRLTRNIRDKDNQNENCKRMLKQEREQLRQNKKELKSLQVEWKNRHKVEK